MSAPTSKIKNSGGALANSLIFTSGKPCTIRYIRVTIDPAAVPGAPLCLMLFDASAVPANGTAPAMRFFIPNVPGDTIITTPYPEFASTETGCVVALSTTFGTLTLAPAGSGYIQGIYDS